MAVPGRNPLAPTLAEKLYTRGLRRLAMPLMERIQGIPVGPTLRKLERSQWWTPARLEALQLEKLGRLLAHTYEQSPVYRQLRDEGGVSPDDIRRRHHLGKLPIVRKRQLRAAFPGQILARNADPGELVPYTSSGSTGEPFRFVMTRREKGMRWALIFRAWACAGLAQGVRYANVMGDHAHGALKDGGWRQQLEQRLTHMRHIPAFAVHDERLDETIETLVRFRPRVLRSYPATAHRLAQALAERHIDLPLRAVLTTGEVLHPFQREAIESLFRCQVYDGYGGDGMDVAFQCGHNSGYHINSEAVILEVTGETGRPLLPGQEGQIVLTNLDNFAMPFVRYAIADLGALRPPEERCPCGRGLPLLDHVTGRSSDQLILPGGRALLMWFFTTLFRQTPGIAAFQVRQTAPDQISIQLVPGPDFGHLPAEGHGLGPSAGPDAILSYLRQQIESQVRGEARLDLRLVDHIPAGPGGKRRFFIADPASSVP